MAQEFFQKNLPESLKKALDFSTLTPQKDSFITDKLRLQIADLLFSVNLNGQTAYIYLLLEHASTPDPLLPFRILRYMTEIMETHRQKHQTKTLPFVYPMILYTGKHPYRYSTDLFDLFGDTKEFAKQTLSKPYQLIDLTHFSDEELKTYKAFRAAALLAKHIHDKDLLPFLKGFMEVLQDLEKAGHEPYLYATLSYMVEAGEVSPKEEFIKTITQGLESIDEEKS